MTTQTVEPFKLVLPAGAPPWLAGVAQSVERALNTLADPRGREVALAADLPSAADNRGRQRWVQAINAMAYSNGVNWYRLDTGATL